MARRILSLAILGSLLLGGGIFWFAKEKGRGQRAEALPAIEEEETEAAVAEEAALESEAYPEPEKLPETQSDVYLDISPRDCEAECEAFQGQTEKFAYCQSACGLASSPAAATCPETGILRDICLKDQAVREQDIARCSGIRDRALREKCQARVTEDFL